MTEQESDDKKLQDAESELSTDDLGDLLESELPYDEIDGANLIEEEPEQETEPVIEQGKEDVSDKTVEESGESGEFPDLDLPLDELPEADDDDSDLSDLEDGLARMSEWEHRSEKSDTPETGDVDLSRLPEWEPAAAESDPAEITGNPSEHEDAAPETAAAMPVAPLLSDEVAQSHEQAPTNQSGMIATALAVVSILIAATAIGLNMGLSDQLNQLKAQQKSQKGNVAVEQDQQIQKLSQEVEKLKWMQNHQAEIQQANQDAMQLQLNDLTKVVSNKVAKRWRAGAKTAPATVKATAVPDKAVSTEKPKTATESQTEKVTNTADASPGQNLEQLVVSARVGNIRSTASINGVILYKLKKGMIVSKVSQSGSWLQVRLENGIDAWAHQSIFKSVANNTEATPSAALQSIVKKLTPLQHSPRAAGKTGWAVNLVSVETEAAAKKQVAYYQSIGINTEYAATRAKGKKWYRIRVTGFANETEAAAYKNMLAKKYSISAWYNRM